jgi:hypothetical protein
MVEVEFFGDALKLTELVMLHKFKNRLHDLALHKASCGYFQREPDSAHHRQKLYHVRFLLHGGFDSILGCEELGHKLDALDKRLVVHTLLLF